MKKLIAKALASVLNRTADYNGWSNYETWAVNMWVTNDQGSDEYWRELTDKVVRKNLFDKHNATIDVSDALKDQIEQDRPEMENSLYSDLLGAAMSEINYYEIAENWVDEVFEEIKDEDPVPPVDDLDKGY